MNNNKLQEYGYDDFFKSQLKELGIDEEEFSIARVLEVQKDRYKILTESEEKWAVLKASIFYDNSSEIYPAVGDFTIIKNNEFGDDVIYHVLNRKSKFSRLDSFHGKEQVVAANFDYVFIMTSLNYDFNVKRIERYLTAAWESGGMPVLVLTKVDLYPDYSEQKSQLQEIAPGVDLIAISSHTGEGISELKKYISPKKTIVFLGSSGVGKSSLVNALLGEDKMLVNSVREDDSKGRHTTTFRQLLKLEDGGMIMDTPGMRELGMWDVSKGISITFSDIEIFSEKCKFRNCKHESEPGCAVRAALESGELSEDRWKNYNKLKREAAFAEKKEMLNTRMKNKALEKSMNKFHRK
ncbi:ribosome small subunit-dependent GTPase A [Clostridium sp. 19966]|uniref:ribosome small subunit-dependent GTPase A n=1 Tax=Clostridium sp. 19966 TaxID=2768166 RepID=UPI0028DF866E|nr:ribosome small subunit-dependent GTPase A [Clostridium sp. 19966]MDT8716711.1 ribosome small subunit-dependent GTPase A [Clostridium sp. 19966]